MTPLEEHVRTDHHSFPIDDGTWSREHALDIEIQPAKQFQARAFKRIPRQHLVELRAISGRKQYHAFFYAGQQRQFAVNSAKPNPGTIGSLRQRSAEPSWQHR